MSKLTKGLLLTTMILGVAIIGYTSVQITKANQAQPAVYNASSDAACSFMGSNSDCSMSANAVDVATYVENNYNCVAVKKSSAALIADGQSKFSCSSSNANCNSTQTMTTHIAAKTVDCEKSCEQACQQECPMEKTGKVAVNQ